LLPASLYFLDGAGQIQHLERDLLTLSQITNEVAPIEDFDVAPDGSFLVYVSDNRLLRLEADGGPPAVLLSDEPVTDEDFTGRFTRQIGHPRISPDGTQIAFSQGGIQLMGAVAGSEPVMLQASDPYPEDFSNMPEGPTRFFTGAEWSPSGDYLAVSFAYFPEGGDLVIYDLAENRLVELVTQEEATVTCCDVSWSADGQTAYIASGVFVYGNPGISRVDPASGQVTTVLPGYPDGADDLSRGVNRARAAHYTSDGDLLAFVATSYDLEISPYYLLQRVLGEGPTVALEPVLGRAFELRSSILWAADSSGAIVVEVPPGQAPGNLNGSISWNPLQGTPLTLPVYGRSPKWGGLPQPPEMANESEVVALAAADFGLPENQVAVLPLAAPGFARLWAAYTLGGPPMAHQVAIYANDGGDWAGLTSYTFDLNSPEPGPDVVNPGAVRQAWLDAQSIWLVVDAFVGVHGGSFTLFRYDGETLAVVASNFSGNPGAGRLIDINGDRWQEVILDRTDYYIFAYATGVRLIDLGLLHFEEGSLLEVQLERLDESGGGPWRSLNNRAVELAEAGLWVDAQRVMSEAMQAVLVSSIPEPVLSWNADYINLMAYEMQQATHNSSYPLLQHVFAGDYWPAVGIMRNFSPDEIFNASSPLILGTVAEGNQEILANWILNRSNAALAVMPDQPAAYFLRAWATYLQNPGSPVIVADVEQALSLSPGDPLFESSLALLR